MRRRVAYFSMAPILAVLALGAQLSLTPAGAVAQRPSPGHPTEECRQCANACLAAYDVCKLANRPRGECVRELQECRHTCFGQGGPCNPQTEPPAGAQRK